MAYLLIWISDDDEIGVERFHSKKDALEGMPENAVEAYLTEGEKVL